MKLGYNNAYQLKHRVPRVQKTKCQDPNIYFSFDLARLRVCAGVGYPRVGVLQGGSQGGGSIV